MKVLHTIPSLGIKSGGTSSCTYDLLSALNIVKCCAELVTLQSKDPTDLLMGNNERWINALNNDSFSLLGYSKNIKQFLLEENDYNLYHTNGLWLYCNHITARIARKKKKPFILSPHGMLYPQALARSAWKKKLMLTLLFTKDIKSATCIHATCHKEMEHIRNLGYKNPIAVIPNPVNFPDYVNGIDKNIFNPKRIGFLGRLHPIKNIDKLLFAWSEMDEKLQIKSELIIMGSGEKKYEQYLKQLVEKLQLKNVVFYGIVEKEKKYQLLNQLSALFVPSKTENFGMIVPEALIMQTPVMASLGTPWEELNTNNCGWWVDNDIETIAKTMEIALTLDDTNYNQMGENGKKLIEEKYKDIIVAEKMKSLYDWILNGSKISDKPDFVYIQ